MIVLCPHCRARHTLNRLVAKFKARSGLLVCQNCQQAFRPVPLPTLVRSNDFLRSRAQEVRAAREFRGHRQKASGALPGLKGDVRRIGELRMECKFTRNKSYPLALKTLMDLEACASAKEDPVLEIEFQGVHPPRRYVVIPEWLYVHYVEVTKNADPNNQ